MDFTFQEDYSENSFIATCRTCETKFNKYHFTKDRVPKYDHRNSESLLKYAKQLEGKTLQQAVGEDVKFGGVRGFAKGKFGSNLEKFYFGYKGNSSHKPDFEELGVELKSTGMQWDKNNPGEYEAKERISLAVIDFRAISLNQSFEDSLWTKIMKPLFVLTDYVSKEVENYNQPIIKVDYHRYKKSDVAEIYKEWKAIKKVILTEGGGGLSQGKMKHNYLEPSTTGAKGTDLVSNIRGFDECKPRRFAFAKRKGGYAHKIIKDLLGY